MKVKRTTADANAAIAAHLRFIRRSSHLLDSGELDEAVRIAVSIRVLLHDTANSTSLLGLVGRKDSTQFLTTVQTMDDALAAADDEFRRRAPEAHARMLAEGRQLMGTPTESVSLVRIGIGSDGRMTYQAPLGTERPRRFVGFADWWTESALYAGNPPFARKDLVNYLANKDGGAHFDPSVDQRYLELVKSGLGIGFMPGLNATLPSDDPRWEWVGGNCAAQGMRQMAYEILETLSPADAPDAP